MERSLGQLLVDVSDLRERMTVMQTTLDKMGQGQGPAATGGRPAEALGRAPADNEDDEEKETPAAKEDSLRDEAGRKVAKKKPEQTRKPGSSRDKRARIEYVSSSDSEPLQDPVRTEIVCHPFPVATGKLGLAMTRRYFNKNFNASKLKHCKEELELALGKEKRQFAEKDAAKRYPDTAPAKMVAEVIAKYGDVTEFVFHDGLRRVGYAPLQKVETNVPPELWQLIMHLLLAIYPLPRRQFVNVTEVYYKMLWKEHCIFFYDENRKEMYPYTQWKEEARKWFQ